MPIGCNPGGDSGVAIQLLQVDLDHNIRVTRARLAPGLQLRTHIHTGHVFAWTLAGTWKYIEYPEASEANSYLYEPAGSSHWCRQHARHS